MGKQFQVYLLPTDAAILVETLHERVAFRLLSTRSSRPEPVEAESPVLTESGFTRADCLLVPDLSVSIKLDYIEKQALWVINTLHSEVIEFSGCHFDGQTLKRGRFFYDPGFYGA